jgi:hypothetical protein
VLKGGLLLMSIPSSNEFYKPAVSPRDCHEDINLSVDRESLLLLLGNVDGDSIIR